MTTLRPSLRTAMRKGPNRGDSTYPVMPGFAGCFGTRGRVRIRGRIDGPQFLGSFMALGDGTHKNAVPADVRARVGKQAGDNLIVHLDERLAPTPRRSTP